MLQSIVIIGWLESFWVWLCTFHTCEKRSKNRSLQPENRFGLAEQALFNNDEDTIKYKLCCLPLFFFLFASGAGEDENKWIKLLIITHVHSSSGCCFSHRFSSQTFSWFCDTDWSPDDEINFFWSRSRNLSRSFVHEIRRNSRVLLKVTLLEIEINLSDSWNVLMQRQMMDRKH